MGAGRKTETYTLAQDSVYVPGYANMHVRNLKKGDLCGVIFGCKFSTIKECYAKKLFGLPAPHMAYIKNIDPGLTLFLFNYSDRTLHGIFEAASEGQMNIDPKAWSPNGTDASPYPAQVKIRVRVRCQPLVEEKFSPVIAENYKDDKMFWFELDRGQTNKLLRMFSPALSVITRGPSTSRDAATTSRKAIPASSLAEIGASGSTRVDKWSSLFKSSEESSENNKKDSTEGGTQRAGSTLVNLEKSRGWEAPDANADERKAQKSVSQSGSTYLSVAKNILLTGCPTIEKESSLTNEVPSQASKGAKNPWSSASQTLSLGQDSGRFRNASKEVENVKVSTVANNVIGPGKQALAEDTCSEIDWDTASSFKEHVDRVNKILEDPKDQDGYRRFEGNRGFASSSAMVPNHWEDETIPGDFEQGNIDKSPCGSSYVSALTGETPDDLGDDKEKHRMDCLKLEMGSSIFVDVLNDLYLEVKDLRQAQYKQDAYMISLQMELLDARKEILQLKARNGGS